MPPRHQATLRQSFCSIPSQTCTCLCTEQQSMTTIMQPFQCDLQPQIQETQRTTHTGTTTRCKTQRTNQNDPSRTCRTQEVPFIPGRSHSTRKNEMFRAPASPKHSPCNIHAAIAMRFAASRRKPARIYAHSNRAWRQESCNHSNAICNHRFKKRKELRTQEQPLVAKCRGRTETTPAAPAAHRRYFSLPAAATLHGKMQGFVLRFPPHNKAHATFMRPLQCVLQHHVANLHLPTNMEAPDDNNHAAIPMRSVTTNSGNAKNYAHRKKNHSLQNTEDEPKRPQPHPPHTGGTFHCRLQPLYTEKCKVSCSGFLLITKPMQHSCGHYNAFCSITWLTCISLPTRQRQMTTILQPFQCDLQPQIQETQRTTHTGKTSHFRT